MTEQEKLENVIKGLECCIGFGDNYCDVCPYSLNEFECDREKLKADALALLKAQESETSDAPKPDSDIGCWYDITHNYTLEQVVSALKAQEPRTPHYTILRYIVEGNEVFVEHPECPKCFENGLVLWDAEIERGAAYCKRCGQAVKWE